jgi:DNA-binding NtrC family response regulator
MSDDVPVVLIADDQADVREAARMFLKSVGYDTRCVDTPAAAIAAASTGRLAAALIDLNYTRDTTSGREGLELLASLARADAELPIIVMTGWGSIELAVEAMRLGAADFIEKPWENARLANVLRAQIALRQANRQAKHLDAENALLRAEQTQEFIATAPAMQAVLTLVERVAPTDANVLILGENGTGKGVLAQRVHDRSRRRDRSFVKVNMGGIPESVFESEMFGHVRGAYTDAKTDRIGRFELADGGTLFLDEVASLPAPQQPKLLRVLEEGEFERVGSSRTQKCDVRVIAATNADLPAAVASGRFRKDLLYRLNTVEVRLPPLRQRHSDILPLARSFMATVAARYGRESPRLAPSAERALQDYIWPGNVRELSHVIERAVLLGSGDTIEADDLSAPFGAVLPVLDRMGEGTNAGRITFAAQPPLGESGADALTLAAAERALIRNALDRWGGNMLKAAEQLGVSRAALYRRLQKFGLDTPD